MRTSISELEAFCALAGGVDRAADELYLDEELLQRALDDEPLSRLEESEIDRQVAEYAEYPGERVDVDTWDRVSELFEYELSPVVVGAIVDYAFGRGHDLDAMIDALEACGWDIEDRENEFWDWFREMYG
jgi:hypothetical protein